MVGLETAFPVMYTHFVKTGRMSMEKLMELMVYNPRRRFGIEAGEDYSVWNLEENYSINSADFVSMGKATPFEGMEVWGKCLMTVCDGKTVYKCV